MAITESTGVSAEERERMTQRPQRGLVVGDGSRTLRNWKHENFAQAIACLSEQAALGKDGEDAYVAAGFTRHRQNHVRLIKREHVARRIEWLRFAREAAAQAARMPLTKVIEGLHGRGIERFDDLVERNAAGVVCVRDFSSCVPVEVGIGALQMLHRAFGIKTPVAG
jgi:hypothetical protein